MVCCLGGCIKHGSQKPVLYLILFNIFINDINDSTDQLGMNMLEEQTRI